jgi:hypothetical protein
MVQGEEPDRTKLQGPKCEKENAPKRIFMQDVVREAERTARGQSRDLPKNSNHKSMSSPRQIKLFRTGFRKTCYGSEKHSPNRE